MSKPILLAMMGLPRSGKSTIVADLSKLLGAPIVRRDAIRLALHGNRYLTPAEPMVKAMSIYMIRSLFEAGHDIVVCDETNYSKLARASLKDDKWDIVWYPVETSPEVCVERAMVTGQADLIPVINEMYARYEPLTVGDEVFVDITDKGTLVTRKISHAEDELPQSEATQPSN